MSSLKYWVWLSTMNGVGPVAAMALIRHFGTPEKVFFATADEYKKVEGIRSAELGKLANNNLDAANKILEACERIGCRIITFQDAQYPDRLRNIYDPPLVLYLKGSLPLIDDEALVAVVGSRSCTSYGLKAAESIGYQLVRRGLIVVTGLARGIDSAAAKGALRGGGKIIGVIGSGLDVVYPPENEALFTDVENSGVLLSEYPPGSPAVPSHFPARNRIISGLSLGVAVIEAPKKSGALITAARALEQGRDVFVLPANVDMKSSEGSNLLLREGAIPILTGEDIVSEYAELFPELVAPQKQVRAVAEDMDMIVQEKAPQVSKSISDIEKKEDLQQQAIGISSEPEGINLDDILSTLTGDERIVAQTIGVLEMHIDDIIIGSGLSAQQVLTSLTMLELKGCAICGDGKYFRLFTKQ